jgi:ADP-ribosylglycohydrolase
VIVTHADRLARALLSLDGLSVGDAFGQRFFSHPAVLAAWWQAELDGQADHEALFAGLGQPPWPWTDDTAMAIAIVEVLRDHQGIEQNALALRFAEHYAAEPRRGYGAGMHRLLPQLRAPRAWTAATRQLFGGQGSFGNGAAMRVAPLGAYFADDLPTLVDQARRSAEVTHAHPEGVAGAIAVALAAA